MERSSFDFNGRSVTYYRSPGSAKVIVLLHGYSFNSQVWEKVKLIDRLHALNFNVFAIDVPGFPNSENRFELGDADMIAMLKLFFDKFVIGKALLLGSSASGYIALKFAEAHGNLIDGLILVGPVRVAQTNVKEVKQDILAIWGDGDTLANDSLPVLKKAKHAENVVIKGAGHACYLDKPGEFCDIVGEFATSHR